MNEKQKTVVARVAGLATLSMADLWFMWDQFFSRRPNRSHIESRIAYKLQEQAFYAAQENIMALSAKQQQIRLR